MLPSGNLMDGLRHFWSFDARGPGGTWRDFGSDGAFTHFQEAVENSVEEIDGKIGGALQFYGSGNFIQAVDSLTLRATEGHFALGFWLRLNRTDFNQDIIYKAGAEGALLPEYRVYYRYITSTSRLLNFQVLYPSGVREVSLPLPSTFQAHQWNYIEVRCRMGFGLEAMLNPAPSAVTNFLKWDESPQDMGDQFSPLRIGGQAVSFGPVIIGQPLDGAIDELAFWQGTVPDHELYRIYNNGRGLPLEKWSPARDCRRVDCCH